MRFFVCIGQITDRLVFRRCFGRKREGNRVLIAGLQFHLRHINRAAVHARRRAGLEPAHPKAERSQLLRKADTGLHAIRAGGIGTVAGDDTRVQIGSGSDHAGFDGIDSAETCDDSGYMAVRQAKFRDHGLLEIKMRLLFERPLHILLIAPAVSLRAEGMDSGALAEIQHAVLDARAVGSLCHFSAQRVKFPHQMPLASAADGGVAGHVADGVKIDRKHDCLQSHPRTGQPCLNAGVSRADHGNVVNSSVKFHPDPSNTGAILSVNIPDCKKCGRMRKKIPPRQRSADFSLCGCYFIDTAYPMRAHFISQTAARAAVKSHNPNFPRPESWPGAFFRCGSLKVRRAAMAFPSVPDPPACSCRGMRQSSGRAPATAEASGSFPRFHTAAHSPDR